MRTKKILISIFILLVLGGTFWGGFLAGQNECEVCPPNGVDDSLLWEAWNELHEKYVDAGELKEQQLIYGAISGMTEATGDPYTKFIEPQDLKTFRENISGEFGGVGMRIAIKKEQLQVISPLEGTPAKRAGLQTGDKILEVNGSSTAGITVEQAVEWIRGPEGSTVTLTIGRESWNEVRPIEIKRAKIEIPSMEWEMKQGNIAYIKIHHFSRQLSSDFKQAAIEIIDSEANKIILDLRSNPGGLLPVANDVGSWFLMQGKVITIEEFGSDKKDKRHKATGPGTFSDWPTVVLINEASASASEILAGALRDQREVKLIGASSFGKGSVQRLFGLSDDSSLKITIAKWLTPDRHQIEGKGLEPDIKVEMTEEDYNQDRDPQLQKAIEIIKSN